VPFSRSDLGPEIGIPLHVAANLNDGLSSSCRFTVNVRLAHQPPIAAIRAQPGIDLSPEFEHPLLISCT
jgi:hypothetical protein